jgi:L-ascorbate metabolism protein UlaG (beta-lactamase superfamily)
MDIQYYGANCVVINFKSTRIVIDDNLEALGKKSIVKADDVVLFTYDDSATSKGRLTFNGPGEYEVGDISIIGIEAKPFMNDDSGKMVTMYKLIGSDVNVLVSGHILGELSSRQIEQVGLVDVLLVPVGNNGYTLDPIGVLKLIKDIEPKIIVPTHYKQADINYPVEQIDLDSAVKELGMEIKDKVSKLKLRPSELSDVTQLVVIEAA